MFKSADNLRLAAGMRALQRVAAPWRRSRTTWFDGTPESLEARLAATERVLVVARSGTTGEHLALAREVGAARAELLAARHRLLTDFLDDGARAFRGARRVAEDEFIDCPYCGAESHAAEFQGGFCPVCGRANYELPGYMASRRTAGEGMSWEDTQRYIDEQLSLGQRGVASRPSTPERPVINKHNHPIHQDQEVYWIDPDTGEVPDPIVGRIIEHPATEPEFGRVRPDIAMVHWTHGSEDLGTDLHHIDELAPTSHVANPDWNPDVTPDPFDPRLIGASRRAAADQLDDLTQRKALNLVKGWMGRYLGRDEDENADVPSGQKAYESGSGLKLHPSWAGQWQDPFTGQLNDSDPAPTILHEGRPGWADDATLDEDLVRQLNGIGVHAENWGGYAMQLYPYREWSIPRQERK